MAIYLALGANLGDRRANMIEALRLLAPEVKVEAVSALYESTPQPPSPGPDYYNAACRVTTSLEPLALLDHIKRIEQQLGRSDTTYWAPRPIDIDIVLYDDVVLTTERLTIPHPRLVERNFVLRPLLDLDAGLVHPVTGDRLADLLSRVGLSGLTQTERHWAYLAG
jgi:2-amino-4-hydroxy-6-hydroxymethyldihydropteridine diphosphokinase